MRKVANACKATLAHDLKSKRIEQRSPIAFISKGARSGASAPLSIVNPADAFIPARLGNIFIDYGESIVAQNAADFIQHD